MPYCPFCEREVLNREWRQDGAHERKAFWMEAPERVWVFVVCMAGAQRRQAWVKEGSHECRDDIIPLRAGLRVGRAR